MADLTDLANVKEALEIGAGTGDDALISTLISEVTELVQHICRRRFTNAARTIVTQAVSEVQDILLLESFPECVITTVHVSKEMPRVYDATTLLVDTCYIVDPDAGILHLLEGNFWSSRPQSIQVIYVGGYTNIPADLERAVVEIIATKLSKGKGQLYHFEAEEIGEGVLQGIRNTDIPASAWKVLQMYRSHLL